MIVNKYSALIGFGLFLYAIITVFVLFAMWSVNTTFGIIGSINAVFNAAVIINVYNHYKEK